MHIQGAEGKCAWRQRIMQPLRIYLEPLDRRFGIGEALDDEGHDEHGQPQGVQDGHGDESLQEKPEEAVRGTASASSSPRDL